MEDNAFRMHRRAQIAVNELAPEEGEQVVATLHALMHTPPTKWPASRARVFPGDPSLYLVRVNSSLRVSRRAGEGQPYEVLDVGRRETLDSLAKTAADAGD